MISNPTTGDGLWVFYWLALVAISLFYFEANRRVDTRWFAVVLFATIISVLSNYKAVQTPIYVRCFFNTFLGCLAIKVIAERIAVSMKTVGKVLFWVWVVNLLVLALQKLGYIWTDYELSGFYTMPWMMGSAACLSVPFLKKLNPWYSLVLVIPVFLSHSSAIVGIALLMWVRPRGRYILLVLGLLASYVWFFDRGIDSARGEVLTRSLPHWKNHLFGDGIGSWAHKAFVKLNGKQLYYWRWAHNELFQMFTETGIFGGLGVIALLGNLFKRISVENRYYLVGVVALSMVHPILHIPRLIPFSILIFAFLIRGDGVETKSIT